jgi:hypothetical protein
MRYGAKHAIWPGYDGSVHARDTSSEAAALQYEAYRRLGPAGRFNVAAELTNFSREMARAGMLRRHPDSTADELSKQLAWYLYHVRADDRED